MPERIRLPKLNNLMTIDYSYHIQAVDRFATLDLESNYSAISAVADARRVRNERGEAARRGGRRDAKCCNCISQSEKQLTLAKIIKSISGVGKRSVAQ